MGDVREKYLIPDCYCGPVGHAEKLGVIFFSYLDSIIVIEDGKATESHLAYNSGSDSMEFRKRPWPPEYRRERSNA